MQPEYPQNPRGDTNGGSGKPGRGAPRHRGRFARFMRGYLMIVGGAATAYVLIYLLIKLLIEIGAWIPPTPVG